MTVRTYRVTPRLWLGEAPLCGATACSTVDSAVGLITAGERVVLPHGSWDTAREVLHALGVDADTASERLHYAQFASFPA